MECGVSYSYQMYVKTGSRTF